MAGRSSAQVPSSRVSVVIPNLNGQAWLGACLHSLSAQRRQPMEIILVDNGSTDDSLDIVLDLAPDANIIRFDHNTGFAHAVNKGAAAAQGDFLLFLNTDTVVEPDCIAILETTLASAASDVASVMPLMVMLERPDHVDDAGDVLSWYGHAQKRGHGEPAVRYGEESEVFSPCGGAVLYRADVFRELGGFDEDFFAYLEDVDLGLRARLAGYRHLLQPTARVQHKGHGSAMARRRYLTLTTRNRLALFVKNIPAALLFRHFGELAYGQVHFAVSHGNLAAAIGGKLLFLRDLPSLLRARRRVTAKTVLKNADIESLLTREHPTPSIRQLVLRRLRRIGEKLSGS